MDRENASMTAMITELSVWITREDFTSVATQEIEIESLSAE